jgi:hypothetical protein
MKKDTWLHLTFSAVGLITVILRLSQLRIFRLSDGRITSDAIDVDRTCLVPPTF